MEIYHKNKDQHDKGLSDEVLKDLLELQRINKIEPKKMDQITDVSSLFKYDMEMRIGDKIRRFKAFSEWIGLYSQNTTHPRVCGLQYPPKVDISNQHNPQGWAYRWHCGSSTFRPDAISAPTTVPGNPSGSPRLRDT